MAPETAKYCLPFHSISDPLGKGYVDRGVYEAVDVVVDEAEEVGKGVGGVGSEFVRFGSDARGTVLAAKSLAIDICPLNAARSFAVHPDVSALSWSASIPILFLTDTGLAPVGDIRASSLQEAIRFASRWNVLDVVTVAEPLVISPRLVRVVKESGLVCVSYGVLDNDPVSVQVILLLLFLNLWLTNCLAPQLQVMEGIDAVIVDSVLAIRKGLTGPNPVAPAAVAPN